MISTVFDFVMQNPGWSPNPTLHVWRSVAEPLAVTGSSDRSSQVVNGVRLLRPTR